MLNKKPILQYESALEEYPNSIVTSKTKIPDWYKDATPNFNNDFAIEHSLKRCMPFIDSLTTGYMVTLPFDLYVKYNSGMPMVRAKEEKYSPKIRPNVGNPSLVPTGFAPYEFIWNMHVSFEVPKGYSMLLTHPLNRNDLPFLTVSGIIDGGFTVYHDGNFPFYVKQGFEGLIPQGTPIAQIIPFRQESWISKKIKGMHQKGTIEGKKSSLVFFGWYKKNFWTKKQYDSLD